jgi:hypothetical protein
MKKSFITLLAIELLILPLAVFAVDYANLVPNIMGKITTIVWQFFTGLAVVMFIVAGFMFLTSSGDPGKINTAKGAVLWGVVGIVVAIAAYSITSMVRWATGV